MIIFAAILFFLLSAIIHFGIFLVVSPALMGGIIIVLANFISHNMHRKRAPIWYIVVTIGVVIYSTVMLVNDILDESLDYGAKPFLILVCYGIASLFVLGLLQILKEINKEKICKSKSENERKSNQKQVEAETECSAEKIQFEEDNSTPTTCKSFKVHKIITIDDTVFKKYNLMFKYHLIKDWDTLQLNFEIDSANANLSKFPRYNELTIKANAYDKKGNLLCIEETGVDFLQLKRGYTADFFYFSDIPVDEAYSFRIYAEDPAEEEYDFLSNEAIVAQYNDILSKSLKALETTVKPKTFFDMYETALENAELITETTRVAGHRAYAKDVVKDLTENRTEKIRSFIDRCNSKGKLYSIKDDFLSGEYELSSDVKVYFESLLKKIETEVTVLSETDEYIYCSLSFGEDEKTYYYKTTDETLKCGDEVIVCVGTHGKKTVARIVKVEKFSVGETPYPPNKTKDILGKCLY